MTYIAHINSKEDIQTCSEHCRNTAEYAAQDLEPVGLSHMAYLAGLLHDTGKYTDEFTEYLKKAVSGETVRKGSVIHTFAGVSLLLSRFHRQANSVIEKWTSEIIAYAVGSHHGFFDCIDENGVRTKGVK